MTVGSSKGGASSSSPGADHEHETPPGARARRLLFFACSKTFPGRRRGPQESSRVARLLGCATRRHVPLLVHVCARSDAVWLLCTRDRPCLGPRWFVEVPCRRRRRRCSRMYAGVGFAQVYDLLDPLFPPHIVCDPRIHPHSGPTNWNSTPDSGVIQFAEFPGVSLSAMQRLDSTRPGLVVSVNHSGGYAPPKFISEPRFREGCQK